MAKMTLFISFLITVVLAMSTDPLPINTAVRASSQSYVATELGTFSGPYSQARSINNTGQIVGEASVANDDLQVHAFLYRESSMIDLGTFGGTVSYAYSINDLGQVTGQASMPGDLDTHAFLYADGIMHDLGALPGSGTSLRSGISSGSSVGSAINDNGTIVGYSRVEAMVYRDGRMTGLSRRAALLANGVNDAEEIVGMLENNHAFLFSNNYMSDIGTLYGGQGQSWAVAINGRGQVVGSSVSPDGAMTHAFLFEGGVMTDLGTLYGGYSYAFGVNDDGVIVGESDGAAFIYRDGVMTDLNLITHHDAGLLRLELAWDINAGGQIVGRGVFLYRGSHAVLLNPTGTTQ